MSRDRDKLKDISETDFTRVMEILENHCRNIFIELNDDYTLNKKKKIVGIGMPKNRITRF